MSLAAHPRRALAALTAWSAAAGVCVVAACSSSTDVNKTPLSANEASAVGASLAAEVNTSAVSLTTAGAATAGGAFSASSGNWNSVGCGVVAPTPITDTDGDGVPDSVTVTYAVPACQYLGLLGLTEIDITGAVSLIDPTPSTADHSFTIKTSALRYALTHGGITYSATRDGIRAVIGSSTSLSQTNDITTTFDSAGITTGTLANTLSASFTPQSGLTLAMGQPLPSGSYSLSGSLSWATSAATDAFTVTTVTPLAYDTTCGAASASPFRSGELHATVTGPNHQGYVKIVWQNCAAPQVTLITS